jgi:phenylpropionate dioxygenase-like ring-hydroxylating dioxygenase large terminal subunit
MYSLPRPARATRLTTSAATPQPQPAQRLVPVSVKRPHWLALGERDRLGKSVQKMTVHGTDLVVYPGPEGELRVAKDACPHRGASLSRGTAEDDGCLTCAYHGMSIGMASHPERHFSYAVSQGLVWVDFSSDLLTQHHQPPSYPEFSDDAFRTFGYSKTLAVNPVLLTENTLDWQHLAFVHRVHFVDGTPKVEIKSTGAHGLATYTYQSDLFDLTIENEYHIPFTTSLRFRFTDRRTGRALPPLLLWFSVTPTEAGQVQLNLRVSRAVLTAVPALTDWIFRFIDELPLREDADIVGAVDPREWSANRLTPGDAFIKAYRKAMTENFPELLEWYVQ